MPVVVRVKGGLGLARPRGIIDTPRAGPLCDRNRGPGPRSEYRRVCGGCRA